MESHPAPQTCMFLEEKVPGEQDEPFLPWLLRTDRWRVAAVDPSVL